MDWVEAKTADEARHTGHSHMEVRTVQGDKQANEALREGWGVLDSRLYKGGTGGPHRNMVFVMYRYVSGVAA